MKKYKKYVAWIAVVLLALVCILPMLLAFGDSENSQMLFRAAFGVMFLLPVFLYVFLMVYKYVNRNKESGLLNTVDEKSVADDNAEPIIKNIVFDIGKVLMSFDWDVQLKNMGYSGEKFEKIAQATFLSDVWQERDKGILSEEEYIDQCVAIAPEYETDIRKVMKASKDSVKLYPYAKTWVEYLKKKGYKLYIISNFAQYMTEENVKNMPFRKYMDGEIFSYQVHELKPDPIIYKMLLEKYFLNPEECVMIDDRPENCEGARSVGMKAVQFVNFKQAAADLAQLGVE